MAGEIFSLFPSTLTDTFGSEHAASNYGWLYISQGIGSIFGGPLAALLYQYTHGWHVVFSCAIGLDFITAAPRAVGAKTVARALYPPALAKRPLGSSDGQAVTSLIFAAQQRVQILIAPLAFKEDILPVMRLATKAQPFQKFDRPGIAGVGPPQSAGDGANCAKSKAITACMASLA